MKFSAAALLAAAMANSATAFSPIPTPGRPSTVLLSTAEEAPASAEGKRPKRKKDDRLRMMKSEQFHRRGFKEVRDVVEETMTGQFKSALVEEFKENNYVIDKEGVKVYLAKVRNATGNQKCVVLVLCAVNFCADRRA